MPGWPTATSPTCFARCARTTASTPTGCPGSSVSTPPAATRRALYDELVGEFESGDPAAVATAGDGSRVDGRRHAQRADRAARGIDGIAAIASFVVVEARQGTVLADVAGNGDDLDAL